MTDIAAHVRIFDPNPSDELVAKRQAAVGDLAEQFKRWGTPANVLSLANDIVAAAAAKGKLAESLVERVETAIKKESLAFISEGQDLQLIVCAMAGVLEALESVTGSATAQIQKPVLLAMGLWSGLSFQKARSERKFELLRRQVLQRAETLVLQTAETSRKRMPVPAASLVITEEEGLQSIEKSWKSGPMKTIDALKFNAALDREEIDILWWATGNWSSLLNDTFSALDPDVAAIASSLELASLLRRLPSESHKHLALRNIAQVSNSSLQEILKNLGDARLLLGAVHAGNPTLEACPNVFPLLTGLKTGVAVDKTSRSTREWSSRALLESSILRISALPGLEL